MTLRTWVLVLTASFVLGLSLGLLWPWIAGVLMVGWPLILFAVLLAAVVWSGRRRRSCPFDHAR